MRSERGWWSPSTAALRDPAAVNGERVPRDETRAIGREPEHTFGRVGEVDLPTLFEQVLAPGGEIELLVPGSALSSDHVPVRVPSIAGTTRGALVGHLAGADRVHVDLPRT